MMNKINGCRSHILEFRFFPEDRTAVRSRLIARTVKGSRNCHGESSRLPSILFRKACTSARGLYNVRVVGLVDSRHRCCFNGGCLRFLACFFKRMSPRTSFRDRILMSSGSYNNARSSSLFSQFHNSGGKLSQLSWQKCWADIPLSEGMKNYRCNWAQCVDSDNSNLRTFFVSLGVGTIPEMDCFFYQWPGWFPAKDTTQDQYYLSLGQFKQLRSHRCCATIGNNWQP